MADTTIHGDDAKLAELAQKMSELVAEEKVLSDDAPDRGDELFQQQHDIYTAMLKLRPTSLEGYSALARAIVEHCCWSNPVEPGPEIGEEQGLALIITSLAGVSFESAMRDYWPHTRSGHAGDGEGRAAGVRFALSGLVSVQSLRLARKE